jgi:glycosyltransferase involved in cell wall biosynthesis
MRIMHVGWGFFPIMTGGLIEYTDDLMQQQLKDGHQVFYYLSGRQSPFLRQPRLSNWVHDGVQNFELVNSPVPFYFEEGTLHPDKDISEVFSEYYFEKVLRQVKPDIIHLQTLAGQPSSIIEVAHRMNCPVVMTLHDYYPLCPTIKLFDHQKRNCKRKNVGEQCQICSQKAPEFPLAWIRVTLEYEKKQKPFLWPIYRFLQICAGRVYSKAHYPPKRNTDASDLYQLRRDVNIGRLKNIDQLLAVSQRTANIYTDLMDLKERQIQVKYLTVKHFLTIKPRKLSPGPKVRFGTLNSTSNEAKGAFLINEAINTLIKENLSDKFEFFIYGGVAEQVKTLLSKNQNIHLMGNYDRRDLNKILENIDVGIVPSIWEESLGFVGIEFLAKGIPIIGNNAGGISEYVNEDTGWINREQTPQGLARIMTDIIYSPEQILERNVKIIKNPPAQIKPMGDHS